MIPRDTALVLEFHASIALPDRAPARVFALLDGDGFALCEGRGLECVFRLVVCGRYRAVVLWSGRGCGGFGDAFAGVGLLHDLLLLLLVGNWR